MSSVSTQCGDWLTVDEENILVMVKSCSPQRSSCWDTEHSEEPTDQGSADAVAEALPQVGFVH